MFVRVCVGVCVCVCVCACVEVVSTVVAAVDSEFIRVQERVKLLGRS